MEEFIVKGVIGGAAGLIVAAVGIFKNYMAAQAKNEKFEFDAKKGAITVVACVAAGLIYSADVLPEQLASTLLDYAALGGLGVVLKDVYAGLAKVQLPKQEDKPGKKK